MKWIPPYSRDWPACAAASVKVGQDKVTVLCGVQALSKLELPGANLTVPPKVGLPVKAARTAAPAALKVLCPEVNSGKGGVATLAGWEGCPELPALVFVPL